MNEKKLQICSTLRIIEGHFSLIDLSARHGKTTIGHWTVILDILRIEQRYYGNNIIKYFAIAILHP